MNEPHLRKLYAQYVAEGKQSGKKDIRVEYMTRDDCKVMFKRDTRLDIPEKDIMQAYAMCKMTVIEETNFEAVQAYKKLQYVEFLEFLGRVAELYFEGSEMEELELYQKIEYLLDELLPLVDAKRVKQVTVIQEFSESDDDYWVAKNRL